RIPGTWGGKIREVARTLTNRSFLALTVSGIVGAISMGLNQGLDLYMGTYFWELTPAQLSYLALIALLAAFVGVGLAPAISRRFGKKHAMIGVFFASLFSGTTPIVCRLMGILPPNHTSALLTIVIVFYFLTTTLGLTGFIIVTSMMADVVEDAAVSTGQRSEGLLFAANGLISKCVTGVGTFISGLILAWVSFPQHAIQGQVDPAILHHLGMVYVPIYATCSAISIAVLMFYDIDRSTHQQNLERLGNVEETLVPENDLPERAVNRAV
ncbi:MAG TPA: MFS transporter, partial [Candidatus Binataceae bacterium]|nr:MFS transporter [Candidatus Binataceae bacterium]